MQAKGHKHETFVHVHVNMGNSRRKNCFIFLDMIGIPNFVSGAMEHWGLITYREVNMLYDPQEASTANLQRVAVVVAHEISHQVREDYR